ncbi:hypothetical protein EDD16DRAFT_1895500 [Pisolithus croceorrhizus]|nr:hypothetical protein EDD16DRAFT_1895500 [Pisolithus croceorrhizus]KAI6120407.1 hypothetical protein EV401DRAFT_2209027 [Pisolithus croceorrhizus]KAI6166346.1 hypothetical protein EDD17DRAFT_1753183 [Pisolithus thermaeus]
MTQFSLNTSAVAGIFGGEEAVATTDPRYGLLANSRLFSGVFPGIHTESATLFELDGWKGLKFRAAHSGSILDKTGHLALLFLEECSDLRGEEVRGRKTPQIGVTIVDFHRVPDEYMHPGRLDTASSLGALILVTP